MLVRKEVADRFDKDIEIIGEETHFANDLGADSLDMTEILVGVEDALGIRIEDPEIDKLATVGQVAEFLESWLKKSN